MQKNNDKISFCIQRIYVKDISFESPNTPEIFQIHWSPKIQVDLNTNSKNIYKDIYEVTLCVTATAKIGENTAFLCQIKQAGIFNISGLNDTQIARYLHVYCPEILFPYVNECFNNQISKGSFPQINLNPINFNTLFIQSLKKNNNNNKTTN
ncbi:protein-export chaperone SecB [Candidatus Blochmannia ocreatus (nom. nud.)]|uniref:Protein-export protein SecB n=1 Tax=Candidatus Blochmannia ocreatus (nom. nud.) TaxID=251538 RepID=A0ABY4SSV8_9ENTR|nr:protein-export chaperone SecB [Candidatus Blochmannia ocreatus]URJ25071.1 protein-export chaperone SecB [Candidatus Blochmannia ocreatus]